MSWEHFQVGLRAMQHDEGRGFLAAARAARIAQAPEKDYRTEMQAEETLLGLR